MLLTRFQRLAQEHSMETMNRIPNFFDVVNPRAQSKHA
jgi:hypothetical protein